MAQARHGSTVSIHYTGRFDDGTVFDYSREREPLEFTIGRKDVVPGFDQALVGMSPGDTRTIRISGGQAYGPHIPEKVLHVELRNIATDGPVGIGLIVQVGQEGGRSSEYRVVAIDGSRVTLDGNHPLAGKQLLFEVELLSVS